MRFLFLVLLLFPSLIGATTITGNLRDVSNAPYSAARVEFIPTTSAATSNTVTVIGISKSVAAPRGELSIDLVEGWYQVKFHPAMNQITIYVPTSGTYTLAQVSTNLVSLWPPYSYVAGTNIIFGTNNNEITISSAASGASGGGSTYTNTTDLPGVVNAGNTGIGTNISTLYVAGQTLNVAGNELNADGSMSFGNGAGSLTPYGDLTLRNITASQGFHGDGSGLTNGSPALATNNATASDGMALVKRGDKLKLEAVGDDNYFGVWDTYPNGDQQGKLAFVTVGTLFGQKRISVPMTGTNGVQLGTPAPYYRNGKYYFAFMTSGYPVSGSNLTNNFGIYVSDDLSNWRLLTYVDCSTVSPALANPVKQVWAPEWFDDTDGSTYIVVNIATNLTSDSANMLPYFLKLQNADLTSWSIPTNITGIPLSAFDATLTKSNGNYMCWYRNAGTGYIEIYTNSSLSGTFAAWKTSDWAGWGSGYEAFQPMQLNDGTWYIEMTKTSPFDGTYYSTSTNFSTWEAPKKMVQTGTQGHGSLWKLPTGWTSQETVDAWAPVGNSALYGTRYAIGPFGKEPGATGGPTANTSFAVYSGGSYTTFGMYSYSANQFITDGFATGVPFYFSRRVAAGYDIFYNSGANNDLMFFGNISNTKTGNTNALTVWGPNGNLTNGIISTAAFTNGVAGRMLIPGTSYYITVYTNVP